MSCDRESVASCQDRLAMSRTVVRLYWVHQRLALCQLVAGPTRVESGETDCGDDLLARADA